jgi:hypothetical protein
LISKCGRREMPGTTETPLVPETRHDSKVNYIACSIHRQLIRFAGKMIEHRPPAAVDYAIGATIGIPNISPGLAKPYCGDPSHAQYRKTSARQYATTGSRRRLSG